MPALALQQVLDLSKQLLTGAQRYLSALQTETLRPYNFDPRVVAAWERKPDLVEQGETRFRQMFCTTCHSLAVTRAGETKLIGGDVGRQLADLADKTLERPRRGGAEHAHETAWHARGAPWSSAP